ncbi:hypothetical protein PWT90_03270 [Aphanocladium album]|nr:hypothetical protein PWT90_03270 [Aphanocladium album]
MSIIQAYVEFEMIWISVWATWNNLPLRPTQTDTRVATSALRSNSLQVSILKIRSILINILFCVDLDWSESLWDKTCWDDFWHRFAGAYNLLEVTLEKENKATKKSEFDAQFTPSLYKALNFIARMYRQPELRRKAIALLRKSLTVATGRLSKISGNLVLELISDQIFEVEEKAWTDDAAKEDCGESPRCVKDKFICNMHRVTRVLAPREIAERGVDYTLLTTGDVLNDRPGRKESVRAVFFS